MPRHVYLHVPFCTRRCSYCDFSIAVRRKVPVAEYLEALRSELASAGTSEVDTIYLGGGTPSRLGAEGIRALLELLRARYTPANNAEVTLEANPEDVTHDAVRAWLAAGVNRLSIGVQSFDDDVLRWMHRVHDAGASATAVRTARAAGVTNLSLDLIFALPPELTRDWQRDLEMALSIEPDHVSLYGLTVEPHTPLERWRARGTVSEAPEEQYEQEFLLAHELLTGGGFEHYEVSNFGRAGFHSRHNQAYWTGAAYAGHGPSAHSFDGRTRSWNEPAYAAWVQRLRSGLDATGGREELSAEQRELERVYLGLRTSAGLAESPALAHETVRWIESGWAVRGAGRIMLTPSGWLRLDTLASTLTGNGSRCNV